jgi:beta-glucosidase
MIPPDRGAPDTFFRASHVTAPWSIYVSDPDAEVRLTMREQLSPEGDLYTLHEGEAIRARWAGGRLAVWRIGGGGRTVDLAAAAKSGLALAITYKVDAPPSGPVKFGLGCGPDCSGMIDVSSTLTKPSSKPWRTLTVPLACFAQHGADLTRVEDPLVIATAKPLDLSIREAKLVHRPANAACPKP